MSYKVQFIITEMRHLVDLMKNNHITNITRATQFSPEHYRDKYNLKKEKIFAQGIGAILITFDNDVVIGFINGNELRSVLCWLESDSKGNSAKYYEKKTSANYQFIEYCDPVYSEPKWKAYIDQKVKEIHVIKSTILDPIYPAMPYQLGILFDFTNGKNLIVCRSEIASHMEPCHLGLINKNDVNCEKLEYIKL